MPDAVTNLLPVERQQLLSREYVYRLGVVILALVDLLVLVAAVFLLPTYVFLSVSARAEESRLANIRAALATSEGAALSNRLTALANEAAVLSRLSEAPSVSGTVRSVLGVSRPGVTLSGVSYTPPVEKKSSGEVLLTGEAATRNALRGFQLNLQREAFVAAAELPVSAYAKDTDIAFTITITLKP